MARIPGNRQLADARGRPLFTLRDINSLDIAEKSCIYGNIIPRRLLEMFRICPTTLLGADGKPKVSITAPDGLGIVRIEVRLNPSDRDAVFFLEIADTQFHQMELAFCIIKNVNSNRYDVDVDAWGHDNCFATLGRNIPEEVRAMEAGLFPNQTHKGLHMFGEFLPVFDTFVDALGMEIIVAEPLTYDNALRYEALGFDYITGKKLMQDIHEGFAKGSRYFRRLDDSSPFRRRGGERTVHGRSWAIHDGILDFPWDGIKIYRQIGLPAEVDTFPGKIWK